jgi:hypothetical protein
MSDVFMQRCVLDVAKILRELDARVIDGTMVGIGRLTQAVSQGLRVGVTGHAQHYGLIMAIGVVIAIAIAVFDV